MDLVVVVVHMAMVEALVEVDILEAVAATTLTDNTKTEVVVVHTPYLR